MHENLWLLTKTLKSFSGLLYYFKIICFQVILPGSLVEKSTYLRSLMNQGFQNTEMETITLYGYAGFFIKDCMYVCFKNIFMPFGPVIFLNKK